MLRHYKHSAAVYKNIYLTECLNVLEHVRMDEMWCLFHVCVPLVS